jgi:hypothetical protein
MIDKAEFYHGAAIVLVVEDPRCRSIQKHESGFLVNEDRLLVLKYTTKAHSPWRFTVTSEDLKCVGQVVDDFERVVLGLVCGGDGVCGVRWESLKMLLAEDTGWIAAKRVFKGCYSVSGPHGTLGKKVALNRWPQILFEDG